jgi:hypothetical protein
LTTACAGRGAFDDGIDEGTACLFVENRVLGNVELDFILRKIVTTSSLTSSG